MTLVDRVTQPPRSLGERRYQTPYSGYSMDMGLILLAAIIIAIAFGVGALVHFLWLGLIILAIVALVSFVVRRA